MALDDESLRGVEAKLERAKEHLESLEAQIAVFLRGQPYSLVENLDRKTCTYTVKARIKRQPPLRIATTAGDCIHNLRSALDHMIVGLCIDAGTWPEDDEDGNGKRKRPFRPRFPICDTEDFWNNVHKGNLKGLSDAAIAQVRAFQPYNGYMGGSPQSHPLWHLETWWNRDKHNLLVPAFGYIEDFTKLRYLTTGVGEIVAEELLPPEETVDDDTNLLKVTYAFCEPHSKVEMCGNVTFDIALQNTPPLDVYLTEMYHYVKGIVWAKIKPFFTTP